jgi:hypothetical protein
VQPKDQQEQRRRPPSPAVRRRSSSADSSATKGTTSRATDAKMPAAEAELRHKPAYAASTGEPSSTQTDGAGVPLCAASPTAAVASMPIASSSACPTTNRLLPL